MSNFKAGEKVVLKSGGSPMIIKELQAGDNVVCIWQDDKQGFQERTFPAVVLEQYTPPPSVMRIVRTS